jgi:hypothetical protein
MDHHDFAPIGKRALNMMDHLDLMVLRIDLHRRLRTGFLAQRLKDLVDGDRRDLDRHVERLLRRRSGRIEGVANTRRQLGLGSRSLGTWARADAGNPLNCLASAVSLRQISQNS